MLRKGFTLIELLIVITIIAILAGAAIPYVQDYIEDARLTKARADLNELRNAIVRFETDTGKPFGFAADGVTALAADAFQDQLVGPYLQSALSDPWGTPYYFSNEASIVYSAAQDRNPQTNRISLDFRPALAPTRAHWVDVNDNGRADVGDEVRIKFTRAVNSVGAIGDYTDAATTGLDFDTSTLATDPTATNTVIITLAGTPIVQAGRDSILVGAAITDFSADAEDVNANNLGLPAQTARQVAVQIRAAQ